MREFKNTLVLSLGLILACYALGCKKTSEVSAPGAKPAGVTDENKNKKEKVLVELETSLGTIVLELDSQAAPKTVENFLGYVNEGFYDGTIFHRVIDGFMIQGGGFDAKMSQKPTKAPIANEAANGLTNAPLTVAMARTNDPNSATAQFFINLVDNRRLDAIPNQSAGYAVFGKVIEGADVVSKIGSVKTGFTAGFSDVPKDVITIKKAKVRN